MDTHTKLLSEMKPMGCCTDGHTYGNRQRTGPTGRKTFLILVDACLRCGRLRPVYPEILTKKERSWVDRYNRFLAREERR